MYVKVAFAAAATPCNAPAPSPPAPLLAPWSPNNSMKLAKSSPRSQRSSRMRSAWRSWQDAGDSVFRLKPRAFNARKLYKR